MPMAMVATTSTAGTSPPPRRIIIVTGPVSGNSDSARESIPLGDAEIAARKNIGLAAVSVQMADSCALSCAVRPSMPVPAMRLANSQLRNRDLDQRQHQDARHDEQQEINRHLEQTGAAEPERLADQELVGVE